MGQSVSRLVALLSSFLPPISVQRAFVITRRGTDGTEGQGAGRQRRIVPDLSAEELSTLGTRTAGGTGTGGRGTPNSGGSTFFGSHFLMGGELYDTSKPEVFLFGDQQDLDLLGNKPVKFPHSVKGVTDSVGVFNALVNVRRDSVKFNKVGRAGGGYSSGFYRLEFIFDCDVSCFVQIHFCAKEIVEEHQIQISSRQPHFEPSERFHFPIGSNQQFSHFMFKPHRYDMKLMHWDGGVHFPVLIEIRSVSDQYPEQVQTTLCSIERSADQSANLILKPLKQKLISNGVIFLLQEIFGIENKENADVAPMAEENGAECIICMANPRDTMILPCRHLCICNGCAETLRYKLNNCPICRSPFKALLKIRAMRNNLIGQGMGADGSMTATRIRREPLTLVEALNGPFSVPAHSEIKTAATVIARCKGNSVVTTTTALVHTSTSSPPPPFSASMPIGLYQQQQLAGTRMTAEITTGATVDWLKGKEIQRNSGGRHQRTTSMQQNELANHIELDQLKSFTSADNYTPDKSRSPSLCRASDHRHSHSHFSSPNSSYQSARSIAQQNQQKETDGDEAPFEERFRKPVLLLASAPDLSGIGDFELRNDSTVAVQLEAIELREKERGEQGTKDQSLSRHGWREGKRHSIDAQNRVAREEHFREVVAQLKPSKIKQQQQPRQSNAKRRSEPMDSNLGKIAVATTSASRTATVGRAKSAKPAGISGGM